MKVLLHNVVVQLRHVVVERERDDGCCDDNRSGGWAMRRLGALERRVMDVLWDSEITPLTGREVADQLPDRAYTTVLTILERLRRKNLIELSAAGRTYRFASADTREAYRAELMIDALGEPTANRSAVLVRFAESVSPAEAEVLRRALDEAAASPKETEG